MFKYFFVLFLNLDFSRHTHSHGSESKKTRQQSTPGSREELAGRGARPSPWAGELLDTDLSSGSLFL